MKKYFLFFLLYFIFFSVTLSAQPSFPGSGTDADPYLIYNETHLTEINNFIINDNNWGRYEHFRIVNDINTISQSIYLYNAYFYGGGKKIKVYFMCDYPNNFHLSLFFNNLIYIDSLIVDGYINYNCGVAGISEYTFNNISDCINNATIISPGIAAGIVWDNKATISHCINNGSITGADRIAGIAGNNSGTITNCINTGKITATNSGIGNLLTGVGGIVGSVPNGCVGISNSINLGNIEGQGFVGGVVGLVRGMSAPTPITNCLNAGYVKGINAVGGILGYLIVEPVSISNCINTGVVEGEQDVGSIVGKE